MPSATSLDSDPPTPTPRTRPQGLGCQGGVAGHSCGRKVPAQRLLCPRPGQVPGGTGGRNLCSGSSPFWAHCLGSARQSSVGPSRRPCICPCVESVNILQVPAPARPRRQGAGNVSTPRPPSPGTADPRTARSRGNAALGGCVPVRGLREITTNKGQDSGFPETGKPSWASKDVQEFLRRAEGDGTSEADRRER